MDKRKNYYIVLDTETTPLDSTIEDVSPKNMLVYDVGFAVVDKKGNVYESYSYVIEEIFCQANLMENAFYKSKMPLYIKDIANGNRILESFQIVISKLFSTFKKYNCKAIMAHNALFDYYSITYTAKYIFGSPKAYVFPYNFPFWDTLKMSRDVLKTRKTYRNFCEKHNLMTKHKVPQPQMKAETIYKYLTQNPNFVESHTGLEDVMIEKEIFSYCINSHKKMRKELFTNKK